MKPKKKEHKEFKDVLKNCTDSEFVVVVEEVYKCIKCELKKRMAKIYKIKRHLKK